MPKESFLSRLLGRKSPLSLSSPAGSEFGPEKGQRGIESDWRTLADLTIGGAGVWIGDAQFAGSEEDGLVVELEPGVYHFQAMSMAFGRDVRTSRLRLIGDQPGERGKKVGETWADTGSQGMVDFSSIRQLLAEDESVEDRIMEAYESFETSMVVDLGSGAVLAFTDSGFGDGDFPVFELVSGVKRVGVEVEMIPSNATNEN